MEQILKGYEHICLYCGKEIKGRYEEWEKYYECDCPDAKKEREIKEKIKELKNQIPEQKFGILKKHVLIELNHNG